MFKRMMAWLLCLVMALSALPMAALATDDVAQEIVAEEIVAEADDLLCRRRCAGYPCPQLEYPV